MNVKVTQTQNASDLYGQSISARSALAVAGVELPQPVISALAPKSIALETTDEIRKASVDAALTTPPGIPVIGQKGVYIDRVTGRTYTAGIST